MGYICFIYSDECPHEVRESNKDRYGGVVWFFDLKQKSEFNKSAQNTDGNSGSEESTEFMNKMLKMS